MDWIRLWILNELVVCPATVSRLVFHPDDQWESYWTFPGRPVFQAEPGARMSALIRSAVAEEIVLYNEVTDGGFREFQQVGKQDYHKLDTMSVGSLRHVLAAITRMGHDKWESDFVPDWSRFWFSEQETFDHDGHLNGVEIVCATEAMVNELRQYFPAYLALGKELELRTVERHTVFGVHVTFWKILSSAIRVKWNVQCDLRESDMAPDEVQATLAEGAMEQAAAQMILGRLSRRWGCKRISESDPRDGDPMPLT